MTGLWRKFCRRKKRHNIDELTILNENIAKVTRAEADERAKLRSYTITSVSIWALSYAAVALVVYFRLYFLVTQNQWIAGGFSVLFLVLPPSAFFVLRLIGKKRIEWLCQQRKVLRDLQVDSIQYILKQKGMLEFLRLMLGACMGGDTAALEPYPEVKSMVAEIKNKNHKINGEEKAQNVANKQRRIGERSAAVSARRAAEGEVRETPKKLTRSPNKSETPPSHGPKKGRDGEQERQRTKEEKEGADATTGETTPSDEGEESAFSNVYVVDMLPPPPKRTIVDRLLAVLVDDDPYALICCHCGEHCGLVGKAEYENYYFRCRFCGAFHRRKEGVPVVSFEPPSSPSASSPSTKTTAGKNRRGDIASEENESRRTAEGSDDDDNKRERGQRRGEEEKEVIESSETPIIRRRRAAYSREKL